jgi:BA14K-like protein
MEPMMISLKVLSTVAALALVLPMVAPAASFAQSTGKGGGVRGGGGGVRAGGVPAARVSSGGAPGARYGGGGAPGPRYGGGGYGYGRGGGGVIPGVVAGAVIGGAIASQGYGYGGPGYYAPGYYGGDQYYDDSSVAVAPAGGDDAVAYCMQTYRSYDPASGTYMGNDGYRHPCP